MHRRWLAACMTVIGLAAAALPATASAADPFVLFLLRMLRDQAISSAIESGATSSPQAARPPAAISLPPAETDRIRRLIDESFVHLRPEQQQELHSSLMGILDDPKNSGQRAQILAAFTEQAEATRRSHVQLLRLTGDEMRTVAAGARVEFARLPPDQRRQMLEALERGVPGMPRTLHEMILAEFRSVGAAR
jgi:hypothetical protein